MKRINMFEIQTEHVLAIQVIGDECYFLGCANTKENTGEFPNQGEPFLINPDLVLVNTVEAITKSTNYGPRHMTTAKENGLLMVLSKVPVESILDYEIIEMAENDIPTFLRYTKNGVYIICY